jgi:hypothetical protein
MAELEGKDNIHWNSRLEEYFSQTAEKSHCFSWLHKRAEEVFSRKSVFVDLPCIILSVLNGAISVGSSSLFGDAQYASVGIGAVALCCGILNSVGSYFGWSRRAEAHKQSCLQYAKLYRFLNIEMSLPRHERMSPSDLLKYTRQEYDRYAETSPLIPPTVIELFRTKFADNPAYKDITFPEETNGLSPVVPYRDHTVVTPSQTPSAQPTLSLPSEPPSQHHERF